MIIILYYNRVPDLEIFVWGGGSKLSCTRKSNKYSCTTVIMYLFILSNL